MPKSAPHPTYGPTSTRPTLTTPTVRLRPTLQVFYHLLATKFLLEAFPHIPESRIHDLVTFLLALEDKLPVSEGD